MAAEDVYEFLLSTGKPCSLSGPWAGQKAAAGFFHPGLAPAELLTALQQNFSPEDLQNACATVADAASGTVNLHPSLAGPQYILQVLKEAPGKKPYMLIARGYCLNEKRWPMCEALRDSQTRRLVRKSGDRLLIAFSGLDRFVLQSFGLPTGSPVGLDKIARQRINTFCNALHLRRRETENPPDLSVPPFASTDSEPQKSPISLVLVAWSPERMESACSPKVEKVQSHIVKLHKNLGLPFADFMVWSPPADMIARLRYCLEMGDRLDVQNALQDSLDTHCTYIVEPIDQPRAATYAELYRQWGALDQEQSSRSIGQPLLHQLQKLQSSELIEPLLREAQAATDPTEKNLLITLASLYEQLHRQSLLVTSKSSKAVRENWSRALTAVPQEEMSQWMALLKQVSAVTKQLRDCQQDRVRSKNPWIKRRY